MKVLFFGCKTAGAECLKHLVKYTTQIIVVTSDYDKHFASVEDIAKEYTLEYYKPKKTRTLRALAKKFKPDIIFSVFYDKHIHEDILNLTETRINFHGGKLPQQKGCFINMWSIINRESFTAITAHYLEKDFDNGDVIDEVRIPIDKNETGESLYNKMTYNAITLFMYILSKILDNEELGRFKQFGKSIYYDKKLPYEGKINKEWTNRQKMTFKRAMYFPPFEGAEE